MKQKILVTGGAGFIGTNLVENLIQNPSNEIVVLDNFFTGSINNKVTGVEYIEGNTVNAKQLLKNHSFDFVFHFGEFSRIVKSFDDINYVKESILTGTPIIIELCRQWGAKLIYSASSSKFGNNGLDENLSPYSWMKAKMVEYIKNYSDWFDLKYEICYFFNVYGPKQISTGPYATVIGIFEEQFKSGIPLTVVKPGTQSRDFTHVQDICEGLLLVMRKDMNHEWHLRSGRNVTIIELAEIFNHPYILVEERKGERFTSEEFYSDTNKILNWLPKKNLKDWIHSRIRPT